MMANLYTQIHTYIQYKTSTIRYCIQGMPTNVMDLQGWQEVGIFGCLNNVENHSGKWVGDYGIVGQTQDSGIGGLESGLLIQAYMVADLRGISLYYGSNSNKLYQQIKRMNSNLKTGLTVAASIVGSATLILPSLFFQQGILSSLVIMVFMGAVYCKTCQLWAKHQCTGEKDISDIAKRVLGHRWYLVLGLSSGLFLILLCAIYFLLLNKILYQLIAYALQYAGVDPSKFQANSQGIAFDKMSVQYQGMVLGIIMLPLFNLKNTNMVLVTARYGVLALVGYFIMLLAMFITSLVKYGVEPISHAKLWASDINGWIQIAGQFSLAFITHDTIATITKDNANPKQTPRAIAYGYSFAGVLYGLVGILGSLSTQAHDYFKEGPFIVSKGVLIFIYIESIFGIFPFVSRTQFYCWWDKGDLPQLYVYGYNFTVWLVCVTLQTVNVSPGIVIAITGTGVGLMVCFVLPIYIHMKCYYPEFKERSQVEQAQTTINRSVSKIQLTNSSAVVDSKPCLPHEDIQTYSFRTRVIFYTGLMLVGVLNFALQIKLLF